MAYKYSPIKSIRIKDFRNIKDQTIEFDKDHPIISLIGENEAGKTSVVKALSVIALNSDQRDQRGWIRDGTQGFGIQVTLEDGTEIYRVKQATRNIYRISYPDGRSWDATKIDGLPPEVREVFGLIEEPETQEPLHIRTYENRLLFVTSPASTNYKVVYDALKIEQIRSGIKAGSKEINTTRSKIITIENGIDTLRTQSRSIKTADISPALAIRKRVATEIEQLKHLSKAVDTLSAYQSSISTLGILGDIEKVEVIGELEVREWSRYEGLMQEIERVGTELDMVNTLLSTMTPIDTLQLQSLNRANTLYKELREIEQQPINLINELENVHISDSEFRLLSRVKEAIDNIDKFNDIPEVISFDAMSLYISDNDIHILTSLSKLNTLFSYLKQYSDQINLCENYITQMKDYLKGIGVRYIECRRCGEIMMLGEEGDN